MLEIPIRIWLIYSSSPNQMTSHC